MAKFVYRLQPLLNVKKQLEDGLKNDLGKAIRKLEHEKNILEEFECEKQECFHEMTSKSSTSVTVAKLREYSTYISVLRERILVQKENINNAQSNVDIYREQLVKVMQEKEMLEKLREKKFQDFVFNNLKQEQSRVDEVVSFKLNKSKNRE